MVKELRKITKETLLHLITDAYFNTHTIARSAKTLLEQNIKNNEKILYEKPYVAAGLYTFAVEEYGKIILLKSYSLESDNVMLDYDQILRHPTKFEKALSKLPKECKIVNSGGFTNIGFTSTGFTTDVIADFEARKTIFYSDLTENNEIKKLPEVSFDTLTVALDKFLDIVENEMEEFNKIHYMFK